MIRYEAYLGQDWQRLGATNVMVVRTRDDGTADLGGFLVDLLCLGVKDAFCETNAPADVVRSYLDAHLPAESRQPIHPTCAKKLIEGAIAYAETLGFAPHRDWRKARKVLSGLDASLCPTDFTYGSEGRPCYVRGPDDDDDRVDLVLARLEARCGPDGFTFVDSDEDDAEAMAVREQLRTWLEREPEGVPRFYEASGLITGLVLCPHAVAPLKICDLLWGPEGRVWKDQAEVQAFCDLLMAYWNYVNTLVLDCIAPDAPPGLHPVDVYEDEFEMDDGLDLAVATYLWAVGFHRATQMQPELWGDAHQRPDLAPHWQVVRWWIEFEQPESRAAMIAAAEATPPRTLASAVAALARALRQPVI